MDKINEFDYMEYDNVDMELILEFKKIFVEKSYKIYYCFISVFFCGFFLFICI